MEYRRTGAGLWYFDVLFPLLSNELANFLGPRAAVPRDELLEFLGQDTKVFPHLLGLPHRIRYGLLSDKDSKTQQCHHLKQQKSTFGPFGPFGPVHFVCWASSLSCPGEQIRWSIIHKGSRCTESTASGFLSCLQRALRMKGSMNMMWTRMDKDGQGSCQVPFKSGTEAVPFIGKDCPSAASEFAHPDVAIGSASQDEQMSINRKKDDWPLPVRSRLTIFSYHFEGLRKQDFVLLLKLLRAVILAAGSCNDVKIHCIIGSILKHLEAL
eukprot:Skav228031  [mRNA]  locus=scaffold1073:242575:245531:- [translate_table: standard]